MEYRHEGVDYKVQPTKFNKDSGKETLQYAVGGLLYMPASNTKIASKIISGEYSFIKSMVLDLEDSLGDDMVGFGVRTIQNTISDIAEAVEGGKLDYSDVPLIFVRVRKEGQMREVLGVLKENVKYITGFNIPKFDKTNCVQYINEFKGVCDKARTVYKSDCQLYIMPIIENKNALYRQLRMENLLYINDKLREISSNVLNIRVGGADFCSVFGIRRGIRDDIYDIGVIRSVLNDIVNVFGKSYVVSGPVWEYFENKNNTEDTRWADGLKKELYKDRLNGFFGKTSIHPTQLEVIQKSLIINNEDYEEAVSILGMNENAIGVKKSVSGNRMNEVKTHSNWARKVIGIANVYGVI
ncbi:MAG: HpcH/HpaI aldolase/citrate lyase family protein [Cellulosilyticum sp.]|nr:HpcH/HpaI aldolase/citrate lyase family protein [Cellulosilyticum sp.]